MKRILTLLGALAIGSSVSAQEFRGGLSLDYAKPHSGDEQSAVTFMGGVMFGQALKGGLELEAGLPTGGDSDYDTSRLRLMGEYDFGRYSVVAGVGVVQYDSSSIGEVDGETASLGIAGDISDRVALRFEFLRDFMDEGASNTTTSRIGLIYNFY